MVSMVSFIGYRAACRPPPTRGSDPVSRQCRPGLAATVLLMTEQFALVFVAVLSALAVFQLLLILGLPLGRYAWGGQNRVLPARLRLGSAVAVAVYGAMAVVALGRAGLASLLPAPVAVVAMWVAAGYLLLSVLPNLASRSKSEKRVMVPVSLVLAALALAIALS